MDSIERDLYGDLQHYRTALHELNQFSVPDANRHARVLHLQRRITWCEGWLKVLGINPPQVQQVMASSASGGAVVARADGQRRGLAPASSMLTRASAAQSKSA